MDPYSPSSSRFSSSVSPMSSKSAPASAVAAPAWGADAVSADTEPEGTGSAVTALAGLARSEGAVAPIGSPHQLPSRPSSGSAPPPYAQGSRTSEDANGS